MCCLFYIIVVPRGSIRSDSPPVIRRKSGYKGLTQEAPSSQSIPHKNNEPLRPSKRCLGEFGSIRRKATFFSKEKLFDLYSWVSIPMFSLYIDVSTLARTPWGPP